MSKMNILDNIIDSARIVTLGTLVTFLSGCAMVPKSLDYDKGPIKAGVVVGADVLAYKANPGQTIQTRNGVTTHIESKLGWDFSPKVGLKAGVGSDKLRFSAGIDTRFNLSSLENNYYAGHQDATPYRHINIPQKDPKIFTRIHPGELTLVPYVELKTSLSNLDIGFQAGLSYMDWTVRSGISRGNGWEVQHRETESVVGQRYGINIGRKGNPCSLLLFHEKYDTNFSNESGDAKVYGANLDFTF
jgi:hypothetical protein